MTKIKHVIHTLERINCNTLNITSEEITTLIESFASLVDNKAHLNTLVHLMDTMAVQTAVRTSALSAREEQVLHLIGIGERTTTIAKTLNISTSTVETHRKNIRKKLKLSGNGKLLQYAIINNLHVNLNSTNTRKPAQLKSI